MPFLAEEVINTEDVPSPPPTSSNPLSPFTRLSAKVSLYTPPLTSSPPPPSSPTTILLCVWLNAVPKHISYYTAHYMARYPSARIILVSISTIEFLFQTETRRRSDISAAVSAILGPDQKDERLFIHSLSNGGGRRVYGIAGAYRTLTGRPLPVKAWVIDSAPGIPQFRRDIHALMVPARKWSWLVWVPYTTVVIATVSLVFVVVNWCPKWVWRELVWGPTEGMNDVALVDRGCVKGYVYSKEDLAIDWRDVERNADVAEEKGYTVMRELAHEAGHVQLFKGKFGEEGYWGFVEKVLRRGLSQEE